MLSSAHIVDIHLFRHHSWSASREKQIASKYASFTVVVLGIGLFALGFSLITGKYPSVNNILPIKNPTIEVQSTVENTHLESTEPVLAVHSTITKVSAVEVMPTITATIIKTLSIPMTKTSIILPQPTQTATSLPPPTNTVTSQPIIADLKINEIDQAEIVLIPAGEFLMGSDPDTDPYFWGAEAPSHRVYLDGYWIYRYEVTNAMYQACVSAGACPLPISNKSRTRDDYYRNPDYSNYPVINVSYTSALSYCRWIGGRLPTEAEWERAARGDNDERLFPWGSSPADGNQANFCDRGCQGEIEDNDKDDGYRDTAPIGSYPDGISPFGLYDMAGNVWEWTMDYFQSAYYQVSPEKNPGGPQSSKYRVIRGGGWNNPASGVRIVQRAGAQPDTGLYTLGFRCVMDAE